LSAQNAITTQFMVAIQYTEALVFALNYILGTICKSQIVFTICRHKPMKWNKNTSCESIESIFYMVWPAKCHWKCMNGYLIRLSTHTHTSYAANSHFICKGTEKNDDQSMIKIIFGVEAVI